MQDITENVSILENLKLAKECVNQKVDFESISTKSWSELTAFEKACEAARTTWREDFLIYLHEHIDFENLINDAMTSDDHLDLGRTLSRTVRSTLVKFAEMNSEHFPEREPTLQEIRDDNYLCDREAR